jgi:hypothetical protein
MLERYLEELERRIEPDIEDALWAEWRDFADGKFAGAIFAPRRQRRAPATLVWPDVNINDAIEDFELMALHQLGECSRMLAEGSGELLNVRCNYGTGILPSVFGVELFMMPHETNTLPTNRPLPGATAIQTLLERGAPDLTQGLAGKTLKMGRRFVDLLRPYPNLRRYVRVYHPDTQGPMDICELLWGSSLFLALLDNPDLVKALLDLITQTYTRFMQTWTAIVPLAADYNVHWSLLHRGKIMLRDDSAMNLSPAMFAEFVEPYDQHLLDAFGGGAIHFCGKGSHYIHRFPGMRGVYAINMSQPEYNDMETIFRHTVDRGIKILGLARDAAEEALRQGRDLHGNVHCW